MKETYKERYPSLREGKIAKEKEWIWAIDMTKKYFWLIMIVGLILGAIIEVILK